MFALGAQDHAAAINDLVTPGSVREIAGLREQLSMLLTSGDTSALLTSARGDLASAVQVKKLRLANAIECLAVSASRSQHIGSRIVNARSVEIITTAPAAALELKHLGRFVDATDTRSGIEPAIDSATADA